MRTKEGVFMSKQELADYDYEQNKKREFKLKASENLPRDDGGNKKLTEEWNNGSE